MRYRIVTNGVEYKIQELIKPLSYYFNLKKKWVDWEGEYGKIKGTRKMCEDVLKRWEEEDSNSIKPWVVI